MEGSVPDGLTAIAAFEGRALATLIAALLTASITAIGGLVLWYLNRRHERRAAEHLRRERAADMQRALRAEIRTHIHQLDETALNASADFMLARIGKPDSSSGGGREDREADGAAPRLFVPLIPRERHAAIFEAITGDVALLPADVIAPVVRYYSQIRTIADFAEDLRSPRYGEIAPERQRAMYAHFIEMKHTARTFGEDAVAILDWSLASGTSAHLSTPARAQFGR
ncbi:MAG: hypothetical protein AAF577_11760 [Pseudomonadota bacterium]